jgi:hypothetical protein
VPIAKTGNSGEAKGLLAPQAPCLLPKLAIAATQKVCFSSAYGLADREANGASTDTTQAAAVVARTRAVLGRNHVYPSDITTGA